MKRIITCNDGTWNKPDTTDRGAGVMTNVEKIYKCIASADPAGTTQLKFYDAGVGTGPGLKNKISGGVTGKGIDKNIKDTYKFLMWNYEPGDQLYFFGFSRGAYTARSLAGFIRNCGILRPAFLNLVDEAYELYRDRTILAHPDSDSMKSFRNQYAFNGPSRTKITCIGVWDTVGALGIPLNFLQIANKERYWFHDVTLSSWVENAYHALAIHERRKIFAPALWEKSQDPEAKKNTLEQVWFSGVHANIGGGYKQTGLSDITLDWMMERSGRSGLYFDTALLTDDSREIKKVTIEPVLDGYMRDSIADSIIYRLGFPAWRILYYQRDTMDPHKACLDGSGNMIPATNTNEMLHQSALVRFDRNMDEKISPYLQCTAPVFQSQNKIDQTIFNLIDTKTKEPEEAGDAATHGKKIRRVENSDPNVKK